jgi:RHS repeat-associated protein
MDLIQRGCRAILTLAAIAALSFTAVPLSSANETVFGPQTCQRGTGAPTVFTYTFSVKEPSSGHIVQVYNGGLEDASYEPVGSSTVTLNGVEILGPRNFNQNVRYLEVPVGLQPDNSLRVEVRGKPGGALVLKVVPFVVIDSPLAGEVCVATTVTLKGHLSSDATGVSVNGQAATTSGASFVAAGIPLVEGANLLTVTAVGGGGFVGRASVTIVRDTTAPTTTVTSPEDGATVRIPEVDIIGTVNDPGAIVIVGGAPVALLGGAFSVRGHPLEPGVNLIAIEARDAVGNRSVRTLRVTYAPPPPTARIAALPAVVLRGDAALLTWSTDGARSCTIDGGVGSVPCSGTVTVSPGETTAYTLRAEGPGGTTDTSATVVVTCPAPTVSIDATPGVIAQGAPSTLSWTSTGEASCSIDNGVGPVPCTGSAAVTPGASTSYTIAASGRCGTATATASITVNPAGVWAQIAASSESVRRGQVTTLSWQTASAAQVVIEPGIGAVAASGALDVSPAATTNYRITAFGSRGVAAATVRVAVLGSVADQTEGSFGWSYRDLVPPDATLASYDERRFSIVTGQTLDRGREPLAGVTVSVFNHPELGTVTTDAAGRYAIPVEGGGTVGLLYRKAGLIDGSRRVGIRWNDVTDAEAIVMLPEDSAVTTVSLDGNPRSVFVHRGAEITDAAGSRSATLVLTGDTRVFARTEAGEVELRSFDLRSTEFDSPEAMPASLPPTSAYTYCVDLTASGLDSVRFSKAATLYVPNFLGFRVGAGIPAGYFDPAQGIWVPSQNGRVVTLLDSDRDGAVDAIDANGDGLPDDLDGDGAFADEAVGLQDPAHYPPGSTFWRVEITHLTLWDCNLAWRFPEGAIAPNQTYLPTLLEMRPGDPEICTNSYVDRQGRAYHDDLPIAGTGLTLHYASDRVPDHKTTITVPASGATVPGCLRGIIVEWHVGGQVMEVELPALPDQAASFAWDGRDAFGRPMAGTIDTEIRIGFFYEPVYFYPTEGIPDGFGRAGAGVSTVGLRAQHVGWWRSFVYQVHRDARVGDIAPGWTISAHHRMVPADPAVVYRGDGTVARRNTQLIGTVAGSYYPDTSGYCPSWNVFCYPRGLVADAAGNLYVADIGHNRVARIDRSGAISTIAGRPQDSPGFSGDGGPATQARLSAPSALAIDQEGNLFVADGGNQRIRRVDTRGIITTVAGNGQYGYNGDEIPARQASLRMVSWGSTIAVDVAGNLYIADSENGMVRRVSPDGIISRFAPSLPASHIEGVAADASGNVFVADTYHQRVLKVAPTGVVTQVAGTWDQYGATGDGGPATLAKLSTPQYLACDAAGNLYIGGEYKVRRVDTQGIITTLAGTGARWQGTGDGSPAAAAQLPGPAAIASGGDDAVYIADATTQVIRRVFVPGAIQAGTGPGETLFADENGEGYVFGAGGWQLATVDLKTGVTLARFGYAAGGIASITDRFGNVVQVQRNGSGRATAIVAPDGQVTRLTFYPDGQLERVTYPDGSSYAMDSVTSGGLILSKTDPRGLRFQHAFDDTGRVSEVFDPAGGHWSWTQRADLTGKVFTGLVSAEGDSTLYEEQPMSTGTYVSKATAPDGTESTYSVSGDGLDESESLGCGTTLSWSYQPDVLYGQRTLTGVDTSLPSGLVSHEHFGHGYQDTNADGKADRITETRSLNGRNWVSIDDVLSGTSTLSSPMGRRATLAYDPATLLARRLSVPGMDDVSYGYDSRGRLTTVQSGSRTASLTYDANGYLETMTSPDGRTWTYVNDQMGRLRVELRPDSTTVSYQYDENGNLSVLTSPGQASYGFSYTPNNQRYLRTEPISGSYQYLYDRDRRLTQVVLPSGKSITNTYSGGSVRFTTTPEGVITYDYLCASRLRSASSNGETVAYGYDGPLVTTDAREGTLSQSVRYTYNADLARASMSYAGTTVSYGYDNDGLLSSVGGYTISRDPQNGLPLSVSGNGMEQARSFSGHGELDGQAWTVGARTPYQWSVLRDPAGRVSHRVETIAGVRVAWDYSYDALGRLTEVVKNGAVVEHYTYDSNGNRLSEDNSLRGVAAKSYGYSLEDQVLLAGADEYQFGVDGFLESKTTDDGTTGYSYSSRGQLQSVWLPDGRLIGYVHDPLGRRIAKRVDGATVEKYLWADRTRLLAVYDGDNVLLARFSYTDGRLPTAMSAGGVTYTMLYDQVGSLRGVADGAGNLVKRVDYDAFGNVVADSNPAFSTPFGFAGGMHDRDTGLVRFGFRDYAPEVGRFTAKDPIDFAGGDTNLYAYSMSNPVNFVDPRGLWFSSGHRDQTFRAGTDLGFKLSDIRIMAEWDVRVDRIENQGNDAAHAMRGFSVQAKELAERALSSAIFYEKNGDHLLAMERLGEGLHTVQDPFAHGEKNGTWLRHMGSGCDDPTWNPDGYIKATDASFFYLLRFLNATRE